MNHRKTSGTRAIALAALALVLVGSASAGESGEQKQKAPAPKPDAPRAIAGSRQAGSDSDITLGTDLVQLDVSVADSGNRPIFDIPKERFSVLEDGVPQRLDFFTKEQAPVSIALVIDTSGSMRSNLETVIAATKNFVAAKKSTDEIAVIGFKGEAELLQDFTKDEGDIDDALDGLIVGGETYLLDAVQVAGDYVQKEGRNRRKALVIISDGVEKGSYYTLDQVAEHLRKLDVRLYLIGFTDELDTTRSLFRKSQKTQATALVNRLAADTGGRAFFPTDNSEIGRITDEIAADLRTVFVLGYYPTNTKKDGTFRKVEVRVASSGTKDDGKITARTRSGYYAGKQ